MIPKGFIALTCINDQKPFTVYLKAANIEAISRSESLDCTFVAVPTYTKGYKVSETAEEILDMVARAAGATDDREMARLLAATWNPALEGHFHVDEVAKYLQRTPAQVKATYVRAKQLAKEA